MVSPAYDCDVLLIGYGPTSATLAALLGQQGIGALIVDKATEPFPLPRAAHFEMR